MMIQLTISNAYTAWRVWKLHNAAREMLMHGLSIKKGMDFDWD